MRTALITKVSAITEVEATSHRQNLANGDFWVGHTKFNATTELVNIDTSKHSTAQIPNTESNVDSQLSWNTGNTSSCEDSAKIV